MSFGRIELPFAESKASSIALGAFFMVRALCEMLARSELRCPAGAEELKRENAWN